MRKILVAASLFFLPTWLVAPLLRAAGYRMGAGARVGFSLLIADRLALGKSVRVGHLNFIRVRRLILHEHAHINRSNLVNGPLGLRLRQQASIGNRNRITRGAFPHVVCWGASLTLDPGSRITADHQVDCTRSVRMGQHSILAGSGSQLWTHGYVHHSEGPGRYRIDGAIHVGHNVYLGSRCIVNLGVRIAPGSTIGAGTVVSQSLDVPGLYVGAAIRALSPVARAEERQDLVRESGPTLCEPVYVKCRDR